MIYCKSHLQISPVNNFCRPITDIKSNVFCYSISDFDVTLCAIYHPYWGTVSAHTKVLEYIQSLFDNCQNSHFILLGDINDLRLHINDFFLLNNFKQLVNKPTRGSNVLDIVASNHPCKFKTPQCIAPLGRSDHKGIFIGKSVSCSVTTRKVKTRYFSHSSYAVCYRYLSSIDWSEFFGADDDVNSAAERFQMFISYVFLNFSSEKTVRMRNIDPPWMSPYLKVLSDARDRALCKGNYAKYLQLREKFLTAVATAKKRFFSRMKSSSVSDRWKSINAQVKVKNQSSFFDRDLVQDLNDKFHSAFSPPDLHLFSDDRPLTYSASFQVTETLVSKLILKCKSNSVGPDGIPGFFFRSFSSVLATPLTLLYNKCLSVGVFPDIWKSANIIPIPKNNTDYRPISILPFLSKVLERLIRDYFLLPSLSHSFNPQQFGFVPNGRGGCTNALLAIRLSIIGHITDNPSHYAKVLAIDYRKAFDSVSHSTLLHNLKTNFSCDPLTIKLIHSFLSDRYQRVLVNDITSPWKKIHSGVPQGSILGPILFVTLIDDFPVLPNTKLIAYADDVTLIYLGDQQRPDVFQKNVDMFCEWSEKKKLEINPEKTKSMVVSRKLCNNSVPNVVINDVCVENVRSLRILGVVFSDDGKWDDQFSFLYKKCCRSLSIVKRMKNNCNPDNIIWQAYISFVFCHMSFCWPVICDLKETLFNKLVRLDRIARRWANVPRNLPSLKCMLDKSCIKLVRRISCESNIHPLSDFFEVRAIDRHIRHTRRLFPLRRRSAMYGKTFVKYSTYT